MKKVLVGALDRDFIRVGRSRIQGQGVFAKRKIPKGARIIEYLGKRVPMSRFLVEVAEGKTVNTYTFRLSDTMVIDGSRKGNDARFFNHSCEPNCEMYVFDDHAYLYAMRDIRRGEELTFDYHLQSPLKKEVTEEVKKQYICHCGTPSCRGTMIELPKSRQSRRKKS